MRQRSRLDVFLGISGRGRRTAAAMSVTAVVAALASGCGGGASSSRTTTGTATTSTTAASQTVAERALFTYAACMRGKGVNIPDPVRGTNGRYAFPKIPAKVLNAAGVRAKAQACAAKLPSGSFRRGNRPSSAQSAAFQKFTACVRKNGVTFARRRGSADSLRPGRRRRRRTVAAGAFRSSPVRASEGRAPADGVASSTRATRK